jgi:putative phosphoribosyl transferase
MKLGNMTFASREDAGRKLGQHLERENLSVDVVLGLPRGGVVVAAEVSKILKCPLGLVLVRKIGHPLNREFAVGALTEHGTVMNEKAAQSAAPGDLRAIIEEERERLASYKQKFLPAVLPELEGRDVLIVDDGLATGSTMEAAVNEARALNAAKVYVAVPVAAANSVERISQKVDKVIALVVDPEFMAVGPYYRSFQQTSDEEVRELLEVRP